MMNSFKRANNALTHAQIVNEYESKVRSLERENKQIIEFNRTLISKLENTRYLVNSRIFSLKTSLDKEPNRIKKAQLALCLDIQEELQWKKS